MSKINEVCSFKEDDVQLLLRDISGKIKPKAAKEREKLIQSGVHYSEMLPLEQSPSKDYIDQYEYALFNFSKKMAEAVQSVAEKIYVLKNKDIVLVSLARAGTPIGILIKRYLQKKYNINVTHYTISIVRGRGIDKVALEYILARHDKQAIQFVDGWTGKGAILNELSEAISEYWEIENKRELLAVIADPANITDICGTHGDIPIASSFLNSTVCGLMSRTIMHPSLKDKFHGVVFFDQFRDEDRTYEFIDTIESYFNFEEGIAEVYKIADEFGVEDINFIKPGIGETTRVLLRRIPDLILVSENANAKEIAHIVQLAKEKNVAVKSYPLKNYQACGIIKKLHADV